MGDIADIVEITIDAGKENKNNCIDTSVTAKFGTGSKLRRAYLSETSMRNMYDMAQEVFEDINNESAFGFEYAPLYEKLEYLAFIRNMGECLHNIGCFYSNEPKAFEIMEDFSKSENEGDDEKIAKIAEIQRREIDRFCDAHLMEKLSDDKIEKISRQCVSNLFESRGIEIYKL